ncbi:prolipoprotein diacylglyceryl transferase [Spiroplasma helicoides]|nr:prolipoprotein diacylglyceryl transferase family protein [Spiroplasma helicoides]
MINSLASDNPFWDAWKNGNGDGDKFSFLYSVFLTIGVMVTVMACAINLWTRKMPMKDFMNAIYIVVGAGVIGGSIFGKLGTGIPIYKIVFFWEAGMSFFGAFLCGFVGGFVFLYLKRDKTKISIWTYADCIVPHVLLGQAIGRWGNLFNHEILGRPIDIKNFQWLPSWVWQRLFYYADPSTSELSKELIYREPLFLYEMIGTFLSWFIIVFFIKNLGIIFSKKPWKVDPLAFPVKKGIKKEELVYRDTYEDIKYKIELNSEGELYRLSKRQAWMKAYFLYQANISDVNRAQKIIDNHVNIYLKSVEKINNYKYKLNEQIKKEKENFKNKKIEQEKLKANIILLKNTYKENIKDLIPNSSRFKNFITRDSSELYAINNPDKYFVINSGVLASSYIIIYSMIRLILDSFRNRYELAFKWNPVMNYLSIGGIFVLGIIVLIIAQFIAPKKWREEGWLYEKSY